MNVALRVLAALLAAPLSSAIAQSDVDEGPLPAFEHASVLPSHRAAGPILAVSPQTGELTARGVSVLQLLGYAYDVEPSSIVGAPEWLASARYQVDARPSTGVGAADAGTIREMVKWLLYDHFGVEAREERLPLYILETAETGTRSRRGSSTSSSEGSSESRGVNAAALAASLEAHLGRPVLNRTGLDDEHELVWHWDPAGDRPLADALREQLGLTLRSVPVDVVVVDRVGAQPIHDGGGGLFERVPSPSR